MSSLLPPGHVGLTCVTLPMHTSSRSRRKVQVASGLSLVQVRYLRSPNNNHAFTTLQDSGNGKISVGTVDFAFAHYSPNVVVDAANAISPPPKLATGSLPKGNPGAGTGHPSTVHILYYDTTKAARILGLKYHTIAETTKDTLADYEAKGW
jgi:hypothetical protein